MFCYDISASISITTASNFRAKRIKSFMFIVLWAALQGEKWHKNCDEVSGTTKDPEIIKKATLPV